MVEKNFNIYDLPIEVCSTNPLTGFFRDGCCSNSSGDSGEHLLCALVNNEFLKFSFNQGNDLITPRPEFNFSGLKDGDRWCLCTDRWIESMKNNAAPKVILKSTNKLVLKKIEFKILKQFAIDLN